jgi:hypothetical protein
MRAAALVACLAVSHVAAPADQGIPVRHAETVERINALGERIWAHDVAAARATDELKARGVLEQDTRIRGWLTDEYVSGDAQGVIVTFVGEAGAQTQVEMRALYRVRVPGEGGLTFDALEPATPLDRAQEARLRARSHALEQLGRAKLRCGEAYNTVVLPASGDAGIRVYLLAATSQPDVLIAGGHHLVEFSPDGSRLVRKRAFTRSCIDFPLATDPVKGTVAGLTLSHLLDPTPTEVHLYLSRYAQKSLSVVTMENSILWIIEDGRIVSATSLDDQSKKNKRR